MLTRAHCVRMSVMIVFRFPFPTTDLFSSTPIPVISYLNKQLNDVQINNHNRTGLSGNRKDVTPPWYSTPHDGHAGPHAAMSTLKPSPIPHTPAAAGGAPTPPTIQITETRDDEPLDAKYFQPKTSYNGIVRRDKSTDRGHSNKPSAYFKK